MLSHGNALQVTTCEQLHAYLSKFKSAEAAASAPLAQASVDIPEGFKAMKKKGTDEELDGTHCFQNFTSSYSVLIRVSDLYMSSGCMDLLGV